MRYTKGEWKTYKNALGQWAVSTDNEPIAQVGRHYNAQLIAAAPDLYEALRTIVEALHANEIARAVRVAESNGVSELAKAEGKK